MTGVRVSRAAGPPPESEYPSPADIIYAHALALEISERTARHHIWKREGLEASVSRPQQHAHYAAADVVTQAAVLAEALIQWHGFVDGNKRTAWMSMCLFLEANGAGEVIVSTRQAVDWMLDLDAHRLTHQDLAQRLRRHLRR